MAEPSLDFDLDDVLHRWHVTRDPRSSCCTCVASSISKPTDSSISQGFVGASACLLASIEGKTRCGPCIQLLFVLRPLPRISNFPQPSDVICPWVGSTLHDVLLRVMRLFRRMSLKYEIQDTVPTCYMIVSFVSICFFVQKTLSDLVRLLKDTGATTEILSDTTTTVLSHISAGLGRGSYRKFHG